MRIKIKALDKVFSEYVRLLSGGYCKRCGKHVGWKNLDNAHFMGRIRYTVRWDIRNTVALCKTCHYKIDTDCFAKTELLLTLLSKEEIAGLRKLSNMTTKDYPIDKEALLKSYKEKVKMLKEV